jgi:hypothetical protein
MFKERQAVCEEDGFEIVPAEGDAKDEGDGYDDADNASEGGSESTFHSSDYNTGGKAEMVAIGNRMRQASRDAAEILEDAYNRYTFDDPAELSRWFADADPVYRTRQSPVITKE